MDPYVLSGVNEWSDLSQPTLEGYSEESGLAVFCEKVVM
jgi:hypothetical protein